MDCNNSSSESSSPNSPTMTTLSCSMERTKLSTKQIRHALPEWMFAELVEDAPPSDRRKKTRRGNRKRHDSGCESASSPPTSPAPGASLAKSISSLPVELQRCFSEWRRERKVAMMQNDFSKQQEVERVMWSAYHNITKAHCIATHPQIASF